MFTHVNLDSQAFEVCLNDALGKKLNTITKCYILELYYTAVAIIGFLMFLLSHIFEIKFVLPNYCVSPVMLVWIAPAETHTAFSWKV